MFEIVKESHTNVSQCLKEIIDQLGDLSTTVIDEVTFDIEKYLCSDLKMLAILYGINPAQSDQPCIWCDYNIKNDKVDKYGNFIYSSMKINRTLTESDTLRKNPENGTKGYKEKPIINIDFNNCVVDTLHLYLRITEKLFLILFDWIGQNDKGKINQNLSERPLMKRFIDFLTDECKLYHVHYFKEYKTLKESIKLRSLNSNEYDTIFSTIFKITNNEFGDTNGLTRLMVEGNGKPLDKEANERLNVINHSFFKFFQIYQVIKNRKKVQTENGLMNAMKNLFITIKQAKFESCLNLTPYLHTLVHHTTEFLDKYKDIDIFNLQGFEKLNSVLRTNYARSTNKKTKIYLKQLLNVRNRNELIHFDFEINNDEIILD